MIYSGQTKKHIQVRQILDEYIEKNCGYTTCITSWYYQTKAFREGAFRNVIFGRNDSLDSIVRKFCNSLTAFYSFTDGSTLKKTLLDVLNSPDDEPEEISRLSPVRKLSI